MGICQMKKIRRLEEGALSCGQIFRDTEQEQVWLPGEIQVLSCHHREEEGLKGGRAGQGPGHSVPCKQSVDFT